ncbi:unnamed protein product [Symbiodinium natans]|uniref:Uncharacterized protein n=1 Tax=Symbiodinium natans TaxID=878477 RepID=A0A812MI98_9DINO|nr:unnamed protein product [Symbiodinium natans]
MQSAVHSVTTLFVDTPVCGLLKIVWCVMLVLCLDCLRNVFKSAGASSDASMANAQMFEAFAAKEGALVLALNLATMMAIQALHITTGSATYRCLADVVCEGQQLYISLPFIAFHCISLHCISLHFVAFHCISLHCISLHFIAFHCIALHYITLHFIAFHCISLHFIAFHYISVHFITFHCIHDIGSWGLSSWCLGCAVCCRLCCQRSPEALRQIGAGS